MKIAVVKKTFLAALALAGTSTTTLAAENAAGVIHFTGQIITPSCEIKGDTGTDSTVEMGTYPTSKFVDVGDKSSPVPFKIILTGCPTTSTGLPTVQLTFKGETALTQSTSLLDVSKITTDGTAAATGIGIAVSPVKAPDQDIKFDESPEQVYIDLVQNSDTDIYADFNARYQSFSKTVTAGPADADMTINILYR
ncbi:fimbrial protein [Atlantibacter sp.]|uniref:fimbrial protein n=1 Tax=Atlantibacter sp. TaxID=1903473 RepID=UPI0028A839AB|nr:fimbrial protein [Atlantibacter sp.]